MEWGGDGLWCQSQVTGILVAMSRHRPAGDVEDFVGFLDEVSDRQEQQDNEADELGAAPALNTSARVLLTLPCLVVLALLLWVAGRFDLWLSPGWLAVTAVAWLVCVFFARAVWSTPENSGDSRESNVSVT